MGAVDNRTAEFLQGLTFFAGLPSADMEAFLGAATVRDYKKGEALFHQGDAAESLFIVVSGWVKQFRNTAEGEQAMVLLFSRGEVFAEATIFPGSVYSLSAEAAEDARVLAIPGAVLRSRAMKNPDITGRMMASLSREIQNLQRQTEQMAIMTAPQRVSCLLLQLSSHMIGKGGTLTFPYDKSLAAARLGMTPETFSRALMQLKPHGVTTRGPEITIDSFSRLTEFSCGHCTALPGECRGCRLADTCALKALTGKKQAQAR